MTRHPIYVVGFMVAVAAVFGGAVAAFHLVAQPTLKEVERSLEQQALVRLFALGDPRGLSRRELSELVQARVTVTERRRDPQTGWEFDLLRAYADSGRARLAGYGFRFRGNGFWGPIEGILAVGPELDKTLGLVILSHKETPGLGGRIEEPAFTDQFRDGLRITPPAANGRWLYIDRAVAQPGSPAYGRRVDAISGATQTCMALERTLNDYLARFHRAMAATDQE